MACRTQDGYNRSVLELRFRAPGEGIPLAALLERAVPGTSPAELERWCGAGRVRSAGRPLRDPRERTLPGTLVELSLPASEVPVREAVGLDSLERDPLARSDVSLAYRAIAPAPPWRLGTLAAPAPGSEPTRFHVVGERAGLAAIELTTRGATPDRIRRELAALGAPALGDVLHGGILVEGGLRLALASARNALEWPKEPAFAPEPAVPGDAPVLAVSAATRAALARGHPWVLTDAETGDVGRWRPGALVRVDLRGSGSPLLLRVEPPGAIAARVWSRDERVVDVPDRVERALERRAPLLDQAHTDAFRLIHGEADGFPALFVDRLGPCLRVLVTGRACDLVREEAVEVLIDRLRALLGADGSVVEVIHLRERPSGELECVRLARGALPAAQRESGRLVVHERGLRFVVDPGLARPANPAPGVGLFPDQRENRERLARHARSGGRWLNLFAHTGAFSVALLAAGADEVVSVDAEPAWLRWLEENLRSNALHERPHRAVRSDARRFLERLDAHERFRGIVVDPPTAASGRRFWSVRREFVPLVAACLAHLEPGGWLLACRNDRAGRGKLHAALEEASRDAGVKLAALEPAPPGADFPRLAGFPEGDPFEGFLARRAG